MRLLIPSLLALATLSGVDAYKILVYNSKYGHSHSHFLGMIADTLAEAGHNVTSLIPILDKTVKDGTEKSNQIIYVQPDPEVAEKYEQMSKRTMNFFVMNTYNPIMPFFFGPMMSNNFYATCMKIMKEPGLIDRLREEKFDVYISENFDICGIGLSAAIQPKATIGTSASNLNGWMLDEFGVPEAISYRPAAHLSSFDARSFFDRLVNIYSSFLGRAAFYFSRRVTNQALKEHFGPDYPTVAEQSANVAYVFTNSEPLLDYAAPTMSRVIDVPGIGAKTPKKLDEYWTEILTRRERTVLLSFGSVIKSIIIPMHMKQAILTAIARFPDVTFIWKYEDLEDEFAKEHASKLGNLVLTKWMPQVDILAHPNLAAFITHGGMGSTQETALRGVPGIFIPVFADQPRNAGMMEYNGFGKAFSKFDLDNPDKLAATIREVLENKKYRDNARRISKMLAKKPFSSKQQLIKHVEFAAEFGPSAALRPQSIDMTFIEYHNLDIIFVAVVFLIGNLYLSCKLAKVVIRKISSRTAKPKSD